MKTVLPIVLVAAALAGGLLWLALGAGDEGGGNGGAVYSSAAFSVEDCSFSGNGTGWLLKMPATAETISESVRAIDADDLATKVRNCAAFVARDNWSVDESRLLDLYGSLLGETVRRSARAA